MDKFSQPAVPRSRGHSALLSFMQGLLRLASFALASFIDCSVFASIMRPAWTSARPCPVGERHVHPEIWCRQQSVASATRERVAVRSCGEWSGEWAGGKGQDAIVANEPAVGCHSQGLNNVGDLNVAPHEGRTASCIADGPVDETSWCWIPAGSREHEIAIQGDRLRMCIRFRSYRLPSHD